LFSKKYGGEAIIFQPQAFTGLGIHYTKPETFVSDLYR
jgi:hypothetical protein